MEQTVLPDSVMSVKRCNAGVIANGNNRSYAWASDLESNGLGSEVNLVRCFSEVFYKIKAWECDVSSDTLKQIGNAVYEYRAANYCYEGDDLLSKAMSFKINEELDGHVELKRADLPRVNL